MTQNPYITIAIVYRKVELAPSPPSDFELPNGCKLAEDNRWVKMAQLIPCLSQKQYKTLLVLTEVYRQQLWLFENKKQSIEDRIVSLSQVHIRPIVRGKAGKPVEFGAKLSASCFEGYVFLDRLSWDNFNESGDLKALI